MKLYGFETFNVSKCTLSAEFAGVDYQYVVIDPKAGEQKLPEHLARHPLGKVPALELDDGRCLFESGAICRFIGRVSDTEMYSGNPFYLSTIDSWMDFANQHLGRWMAAFFFQEKVSHGLLGNPVDQAAIAEAQGWLDQQLPVLDRRLAGRACLVGENLTIADTFMAAFIQIHEVTSVNLDAYANIMRWYSGLRSEAAYDRAMSHFPGAQLFN
jgi:glutathione S-transferase